MREEMFTQEEFDQQKAIIIDGYVNGCVIQQQQPYAILLGGQPGAGKSVLANIFTTIMDKNVVFISGDDFRCYHPRYKELQDKYQDDAVVYTQKFSGLMTEALIQYFSKQKYNLIIEGTLRTKEVPLQTKALLDQNGYNVDLGIIMARPEISYLSTVKRYCLMKKYGGVPRKTPKKHHDLVVRTIANHLDYFYQKGTFRKIKVFNRASMCIYDSAENSQVNPGDLLAKEFSRRLSPAEKKQIIKEYQEYVRPEKIREILRNYEVVHCARPVKAGR